eukprot:Colp12_sorted_trinity150504_noHs@1360
MDEVRQWLERFELLQYAEDLEKEGYDSMRALREITEQDMNTINMRRGHQRLLLKAIDVYNNLGSGQPPSYSSESSPSETSPLQYPTQATPETDEAAKARASGTGGSVTLETNNLLRNKILDRQYLTTGITFGRGSQIVTQPSKSGPSNTFVMKYVVAKSEQRNKRGRKRKNESDDEDFNQALSQRDYVPQPRPRTAPQPYMATKTTIRFVDMSTPTLHISQPAFPTHPQPSHHHFQNKHVGHGPFGGQGYLQTHTFHSFKDQTHTISLEAQRGSNSTAGRRASGVNKLTASEPKLAHKDHQPQQLLIQDANFHEASSSNHLVTNLLEHHVQSMREPVGEIPAYTGVPKLGEKDKAPVNEPKEMERIGEVHE